MFQSNKILIEKIRYLLLFYCLTNNNYIMNPLTLKIGPDRYQSSNRRNLEKACQILGFDDKIKTLKIAHYAYNELYIIKLALKKYFSTNQVCY